MKLIVITRPDFFPEESELIASLFGHGLETLHLRKPDASPEAVEALLRRLPSTCLPHIVLHEHFQLAASYGLKGIHLNRRHPQAPQGFTGSVSRSCHTMEEVVQWKPCCQYLFLSPIFDSISKQGYAAGFAPETLREAARTGVIDRKVVALGGITAERIPLLRQLGFGGAALLGDVWQQPEAAFIPHFMALKEEADR